MHEPIYLARTVYEALGAPFNADVEEMSLAHRSLVSPYIKDVDMSPRELALVNAIRNHVAHEERLAKAAAVVTAPPVVQIEVVKEALAVNPPVPHEADPPADFEPVVVETRKERKRR